MSKNLNFSILILILPIVFKSCLQNGVVLMKNLPVFSELCPIKSRLLINTLKFVYNFGRPHSQTLTFYNLAGFTYSRIIRDKNDLSIVQIV